jgi:alkylation response protein AidB-like acyl-CoA dehydrogenase
MDIVTRDGTDISDADWLARARALRPLIEAAAPRTEAGRQLAPDVVTALHDAGMFRLLIPRDIGGAELRLSAFSPALMEIAAGDGSVGWCVGQGSGCSLTSAYLSPEAAWDVFGDRASVLAWGAGVGGIARRAQGGWRVTGRWSYASGSRHATWMGGLCALAEADGTPIPGPSGAPATLTLVWPKSDTAMIDDWYTMGLRGTGSDSYEVSDLFVPAERGFNRNLPPARPAVLYRLPLSHVYPVAFASVALGIAGGMLDAFVALVQGKTPRGGQAMRDSGAIHSILGQLAARHGSARAALLGQLREMEAGFDAGGTLTDANEVMLRMATTFTIHEALAVADTVFHEAGATAIHVSNPFERRLRDVHAVSQQVQARRANYEGVGRRLLGLPGPPLFI